MSRLTYRNAVIEDLPKIVAIYNSTIPSRIVTADTEPVSIESRNPWFYKHSADKRPLWIVENEMSEIIGWVSYSSFYGRPAYNATVELSIYLDEDFRGKGYGKQILQHCINESPSLGIKTILGYIFAHNEPSLKLFENLGFKEWGFFPNIAVLDGVERSLKILGRRVA